MNIQELVEKIKQTPYDKQLELIDSIPIEDCINVINSDDYMARYYVIGRKYSIDELEYLSSRIPLYDFINIIEKFDIKSEKELSSILNMDILNEEDKDKIFIAKIFNLPEEDICNFIDSYTAIDDEKLRIIGLSSFLSDSKKQYLIKNSKYGGSFAQNYIANIDYDLSLETNEVYNDCLEKIAQSLDTNKEEMKYYISILGQNNPQILHTIDYKMLTSDFRDLYSLNYDKTISNTDRLFYYHDIQQSITNFGDSPVKVEMLKEIFKYIDSKCVDNWEAYVYLITNSFGLNKDFYDSLQLNNAGKVFTDVDIEKLMAYCSIKDREYQISDITDLINIDKVRSEYVTKIFNNQNSKQWDLQNALLEKKYGINLKYAEKFISTFNINDVNIDSSMVEMSENIKKILKMKNQELRNYEKETELGEMINIIDLQKELKNVFEKEYEKQLFKPNEENYIKTEDGIKIYNAGVDFSMITHSIGAVYQKQNNALDSEHWNRRSISLDSFSASFIRNDSLGFCNIRTSVYGFSNLDEDWLLDMRNQDYNSGPSFANGLSLSILNQRNHGDRMAPDEMIKNTGTASDYNEFLVSKYSSNGTTRKPDYIVFACDDFEKDIESEKQLTACEFSGKIAYQNTLKAAKEFNIPIVVIERNKILKNEKEKIETAKGMLYKSEEELNEEQIKSYIDNIITRYRTNFLGMKTSTDTEKYKNTGISIENYVKDCNAILEYAKYLESIDERLSKIVLDGFNDAIKHPPVIHQLYNDIDEKLMQKYDEIFKSKNELETSKTR